MLVIPQSALEDSRFVTASRMSGIQSIFCLKIVPTFEFTKLRNKFLKILWQNDAAVKLFCLKFLVLYSNK